MTTAKEQAYAKINLFLDVIGKRSDGFHEIRSVMHAVSLADTLTVTVSPASRSTVSLVTEGAPYVPTDGSNLVCRAANAFLCRLGTAAQVRIALEKRIPVGAGLAGGSSDAAATLRVLNRLFSRPFSLGALLSIAEEIGSDVPFCLLGKSALCEGRGEKLTPLVLPPMHFVIAASCEYVSTPAAYASLDRLYSDFDGSVPGGGAAAYRAFSAAVEEGRTVAGGLYNIFESAVLSGIPKAAEVKKRLSRLGAEGTLMSGSGSAVFGIFPDETSAALAESALRTEGYRADAVRSV